MKNVLCAALLCAPLFALGLFSDQARAAPQEEGDLPGRLLKLERRVGELERSNRQLELEVQESGQTLAALAEEGKALAASLDESESLGFTAGINPQSRIVLLGALRSFTQRLQSLGAEGATEEADGASPTADG